MEFNWTIRQNNSAQSKYFYYYIDGCLAISVYCHRYGSMRGMPWTIEVAGWNVPNSKFEWHKRFHKDDILSHVEHQAKAGHKETVLAIFNRIFEGNNDF